MNENKAVYRVIIGGIHVDTLTGSITENIDTINHYVESYNGSDVQLQYELDYNEVSSNINDTLSEYSDELEKTEEEIEIIANYIALKLIKDGDDE